ncbi:MAG TPA: DNA polymerase III subunit alpha, partial [Saprospiraceae bacterium]|nr:DNA polymerase III subunit alpha [Saprospiraceae bacterium]
MFDKIEPLKLTRDILMPNYDIPPNFASQTEYLRHLSYEGAKRKYGELSMATKERLDHELGIIDNMGFPGYFLITQDLINAARELGVWVGPGRGSAAGSAIAYTLGITNVDPIGYDLLFERFLNPERVSMPDIDIDFDDEGRQKVIDYVVKKYGRNQVAQIITYGTMAAKLSIRDTARVMELPLSEADRLAKLVPMKPGTKLKKILVKTIKELSKDYQPEDVQNIEKLQEIAQANTLEGEVLRMAHSLEGSVRNTGIHAAGVIIAPSDIREYIPVSTAKDADLFVTQYDGKYVESAGMLKMDFLGLKTLSILKDAVQNIVLRYGEDHRIELDDIPLDDPKTYELFQRGDMIGIFQFESEGMRKHMRDLKPTNIEDLIAMNALYRPGPMDNIPTYIARKHGKEAVKYPHPMLEKILKPTFGIMVYQEQIMQAAQIMAGYSLGQADVLRRAMGKKKKSEMEKQSAIFVKGAAVKGVPEDQAREVFSIMERFASYGFNRSHAACYAILAFQTGFLKANYKPEFMASVMTHSKNDLTKLKFFLDECKRMDVEVLGPDVNESHLNFTVNAEGKIRFGLSALKGVGEGPVNEIVAERDKNGPFLSPYDMVRRLPLKAFNKRVMESLIYGGAFDFFSDLTRAQYFLPSGKFNTYMEHLLKYGNVYQHQKETAANTLFGASEDAMVPQPEPPTHTTWNLMEKLTKEKEVAGIYISGHPLDDYQVEVKQFASCSIDRMMQFQNATVRIAAFVNSANHRFTKRGDGFGFFSLEDYSSTTEIALFKEDYQQFKNLLEPGSCVLVEGTIRMDRYRNEWTLKVNNVHLLSSLLEKKTSTIEIQLPLAQIQPKMLDRLETLFKANRGQKTLRFAVIDPKNKQVVRFLSEKRKVKIDHELTA